MIMSRKAVFSNEIFIYIPKSDFHEVGETDSQDLNLSGVQPTETGADSDVSPADDGIVGEQDSLADPASPETTPPGDTNDDPSPSALLYFPHIAANTNWETEICIINANAAQGLSGALKAYSHSGQELSSTAVALAPNARKEMRISDALPQPGDIGYIVFASDSGDACGYTKFYIEGKYRAAIPATTNVNAGDIHIPHIASGPAWWTGISLVNTTSASKDVTLEFDNGASRVVSIAAGEHQVFTIRSLFGGTPQPTARSAVMKNSAGVIGLELFGSTDESGDSYLSGILLKDETAAEIYYPHVANGKTWWTGIVAYNPSGESCDLVITPFRDDGAPFSSQAITLAGRGKYVGTAEQLNFPAGTAWFRIAATSPVTGFELFGTRDGNQLGGYTGVGISRTDGVFAKIEKDGWTGIAFVNIEPSTAVLTMTAHDDDGREIAAETIRLSAYEKVSGMPSDLFSQDITAATYISYTSNTNIVGFQLNGAADDMMLDGLPGM